MTGKLQGIASLAGWAGLILFSGCSTLSRFIGGIAGEEPNYLRLIRAGRVHFSSSGNPIDDA